MKRTAVRRAQETGGWKEGWWAETGKNSGTRSREKGRGKSGMTECILSVTSEECGGHWCLIWV